MHEQQHKKNDFKISFRDVDQVRFTMKIYADESMLDGKRVRDTFNTFDALTFVSSFKQFTHTDTHTKHICMRETSKSCYTNKSKLRVQFKSIK